MPVKYPKNDVIKYTVLDETSFRYDLKSLHYIFFFFCGHCYALLLCCKTSAIYPFVVEGKYTFPVFTVKVSFNPNIKHPLEKQFRPLRGIICSLHLHEAIASWASVYSGAERCAVVIDGVFSPLPLPPEEKSTVL